MTRFGPRNTVDAADLASFLDYRTELRPGGRPARYRSYINGIAVTDSDRRMIRRWRNGQVKRVTTRAANALLHRYQITTTQEDS